MKVCFFVKKNLTQEEILQELAYNLQWGRVYAEPKDAEPNKEKFPDFELAEVDLSIKFLAQIKAA